MKQIGLSMSKEKQKYHLVTYRAQYDGYSDYHTEVTYDLEDTIIGLTRCSRARCTILAVVEISYDTYIKLELEQNS